MGLERNIFYTFLLKPQPVVGKNFRRSPYWAMFRLQRAVTEAKLKIPSQSINKQMNNKSLPFLCSARSFIKFSILLTAALAGLNQPVSAQVTIQIVNDSGLPDTNVFVKVPGKYADTDPTHIPITPANLFADINNPTPPNPVSVPLSNLTPVFQLVSPISGATNPVYSFQADYIASGSVYFTFRQPFTFTNGLQPSPPPDSSGNAYRYDYAELSISDTNAANNAMDVTYVDKFGIPLQLEWFRGTNLMAGSYVYASTKTLVDLFASNNLAAAVFSLNASNIASGWQYTGPDAYTNFARILAPQKVSGTNASVAPYPNIAGYLNSLAGSAHAFALNGASPQGGYYYVGYQVKVDTTANGWLFTLAYDSNSVPPYATNLISVGNLPYTNTITFSVTTTNASQYIYGAPVGPNLYSTNGIAVTNNTSATYAVETWMIGDVLSSLNYGFWGGNYGTNSEQWYSEVEWTSFPFGWARPTGDGFYNLYAALIYYNSDPYSFAFSERITPDVLLAPANNDTVRITILPDDRLNSPVVWIPTNLITASSMTLNWNPVPGATSYQVNVLRPLGFGPTNVSSNTYTVSGLASGTPYVMSVQALGTAHGNPIITPARPVSATTLGTNATTTGGSIPIQVTFSAADPYYQLETVYINGFQLFRTNSVNGSPWENPLGQNAGWLASTGLNQVVVTVVDNNNNVVFNDWLQFVLQTPFPFVNQGTNTAGTPVTFTSTNTAISGIVLYGQKRSQPSPTLGGLFPMANTPFPGTTNIVTNYVGSATNFLVYNSVVIGLSYVPAETRKFAPAVTTVPAASVTITNVVSLPGGGIQFSFNVPAGTNYAVEASGNLINWRTNITGTGQSGGESYTNAFGTNIVQFYRIKL
jgi:hypothetical protein